jgi:hypothetical protein
MWTDDSAGTGHMRVVSVRTGGSERSGGMWNYVRAGLEGPRSGSKPTGRWAEEKELGTAGPFFSFSALQRALSLSAALQRRVDVRHPIPVFLAEPPFPRGCTSSNPCVSCGTTIPAWMYVIQPLCFLRNHHSTPYEQTLSKESRVCGLCLCGQEVSARQDVARDKRVGRF